MVGWILHRRWRVVTVMLCMVYVELLPRPVHAAPVAQSGQVLPALYFVTAPKRRYRELRLVQAEGGGRYAQQMLRNLQLQALELGADAIVHVNMFTTKVCERDLLTGVFGITAFEQKVLWVEGVAVRYVR